MAISNPVKLILPKTKKNGGVSFTPTFKATNPLLTTPTYRDHQDALYDTRLQLDSRDLLKAAVNHDPDVSAAVHAYLTIASSADLVVYAYDMNGQLDPNGIDVGKQILDQITVVNDYSVGFSNKPLLQSLLQDLRYYMLLRGMNTAEIVFDKTMVPSELRLSDPATIWWYETKPGVYQPQQRPIGSGQYLDLNIPTFFVSRFHQSPADVYSFSPFVAAINTIAARQEVINELYRIMRVVGFPRLDFEVLEEVLLQNAPVTIRQNPEAMRKYVEDELGRVRSALSNIRSDLPLVHSSSVKAKIINDKNPGAGMPITDVIGVLDAQNQAALKVLPAVIGKSTSTQVASTEARLFALGADSLNRSIAETLTQALTLAARLAGYQGRIVARFNPVELRPQLELEPQKVMKSARLKQDLSAGLITDLEYHMEMYQRPPPPGTPELSGTNFLAQNAGAASVDPSGVTPNSDPLGRSLAPEGGNSAKSNAAKAGTGGKTKLTFELD